MKKILFLLFPLFLVCYALVGCRQVEHKVEGKDSVLVAQKKTQKSPGYKNLQAFNGDTVAYMKYNFQKGAGYYPNKKMIVLFNAIELPIHNFVPGNWDEKTFKTDFVIFHFYPDREENLRRQAHKNPLTLYVYFEEPVPYQEMVKYSKRRTTDLVEALWDDEAKKFLQGKKIRVISLPK